MAEILIHPFNDPGSSNSGAWCENCVWSLIKNSIKLVHLFIYFPQMYPIALVRHAKV